MPVPTYAQQSCCSSPRTATSKQQPAPRPRGLWKARGSLQPRLATPTTTTAKKRQSATDHYNDHDRFYTDVHQHDNDEDHILSGDESESSSSSSWSKRRRVHRDLDSPPTSEDSNRDDFFYWDYSRQCAPNPDRLSKWSTRTKLMDTTSTVGPGQPDPDRTSCDLEDWEDLKELFAKAVEMYEGQDGAETVPLLRGVIHECHRFLIAYEDPSVIYTKPSANPADRVETPPEEHIIRDWLTDRPPLYPPPGLRQEKKEKVPVEKIMDDDKKCKCKDLPTAFYTILGTTLFFFGNLIAQHPSLAVEGEPSLPTPYWLSALDVFEIGENLPIKTSGLGCQNAPEDWRMGIVWGRTLVSLAEEVLNRQKAQPTAPTAARPVDPAFGQAYGLPAPGTPDEPAWPEDSPFAIIVARRPPISRRLTLADVTVDELLFLAQDQFARGMFHMPHPQHSPGNRYSSSSSSILANMSSFPQRPPISQISSSSTVTSIASISSRVSGGETFSRAKELFTIGSEVLFLAEKLDTAAERLHWASWADGVFSQMKMESDSDTWRGPLASARGRCCLVMGSAQAEDLEAALEKGDMDVLKSPETEEARQALRSAVKYLEKAMEVRLEKKRSDSTLGKDSPSSMPSMVGVAVGEGEGQREYQEAVEEEEATERDSQELKTLLAEALITLANLIVDPKEREVLYAKAQKEGGGSFELDSLSSTSMADDEDRMDESR